MLEGKKDNFQKEVLESDKRVLVDFNAGWCGPCRMLKPILEELSKTREDIKIVSVDIDEEEELASEYQVSAIPCIVLMKNGKEEKRNVGFLSREELEEFLGE